MKYDPKIHHRRSIRLPGYDYSQAGAYFITGCCHNKKSWFGKIVNNEIVLNEYGKVAYNEWIKLTERFSNFELDVFQIMPNHMHGIIVLNEVRKPLTDKVPLNLQEDDSTERTTERVAEKATERVVERATARVAERTTERVAKRATARVAPTIGDIIGSYKSLVANECLKIFKLKWENVGAGLAHAHAHENIGAGASPATTAIMGKLWQRNYFEHIIRNEKSYQTISSYIINNPNSWKDDQFFEE